MKDFNSYFESIPELETERLRLTAFTREDMDAYFDILRDPKVQKYLGGGVPVFDKDINDRLLKRKIVFTWCIRDKESNRVVGRIDLGGFVKKTTAEISYHLSSDFWGREIATEAVERVTRFGLDELGLARIQGLVRIENQASIRVLEKNGYLREGLLHHYPFGREFHDIVMLNRQMNTSFSGIHSRLSRKLPV
jgi:Acetyltransferases, including N-acetylases of ribosomal proteins